MNRTNVLSSRRGAAAIDGIGREAGRFVVTTMPVPWELTRERLGAAPAEVLMVDSMQQSAVDAQIAAAATCDTVVAIGGGQAIDLGKYLAWRRGCRLITIPTVVSVDAFVTPKAALRQANRVVYVGHASPDPLIIDYELIRTAPRALNVAGAGDLLSIHTATFDWELAERAGRSEYPFSAADADRAREILADTAVAADDIAAVSDAGIDAIVDGYLRVNTICLPADHYRVEEGSEHFLFYELEERLARSFIHGPIIGLGIYLMSRLQHNRPEWITGVMDRMGLDYQPAAMGIDRSTLAASLAALRDYTARAGLWYTVINESPIDQAWIDEALAGLRFA